jgi:hypothetical protein
MGLKVQQARTSGKVNISFGADDHPATRPDDGRTAYDFGGLSAGKTFQLTGMNAKLRRCLDGRIKPDFLPGF